MIAFTTAILSTKVTIRRPRKSFTTQVGHYAGYNLVGRTEVEPIPTDPDFKITGRLWLHGTYPVLAPQQLRGDGLIRYRYADPTRGDDVWDWTAGNAAGFGV